MNTLDKAHCQPVRRARPVWTPGQDHGVGGEPEKGDEWNLLLPCGGSLRENSDSIIG